MTDAGALLPCPFCGRPPARTSSGGYTCDNQSCAVICGVPAEGFDPKHDPLKVWNTRTAGGARKFIRRGILDFKEHELREIVAEFCKLPGIAPVAQGSIDPLSRDERHAVEHARYQVGQASMVNPDCCFDYDLVKDLLRALDRAYPVPSASRGTEA